MNSKVIGVVIVILVIVAGAFLLLQNNSNTQTPATTTESDQTSTPSTSMPEDESSPSGAMGEEVEGVREFTVTASNFKFAPITMSVKKGDTVRITFKNTQGMHDFVIEEFDVNTEVIDGAGEEVVEFVADEAGKFEYYCSVGNHRQMGMVGTLTVTE